MAIQTYNDNHNAFDNNGEAVIRYNDFTFPNMTTSRVSSEPVYNESDSTIKYVKYVFNVSTVITNTTISGGNDSNTVTGSLAPFQNIVSMGIEEIRELLSTPGRPFIFVQQGFGNFAVNCTLDSSWSGTAAGVVGKTDVNFGPKPRLLSWEPIGSSVAVRIVWELEVCVAEFGNTSSNSDNPRDGNYSDLFSTGPLRQRILSLEYEIDWQISENGRTERRIVGHYEHAGQWWNSGRKKWSDNKLVANADDIRDAVLERIPPLKGFHRSYPLINLSKDRKTLSFTILDKEIPSKNPFSAGMVDMDITHKLSTTLPKQGGTFGTGGFQKWLATIQGTVEVAPGYHMWFAWYAITGVIRDRLERALNYYSDTFEDDPNAPETSSDESSRKKKKKGRLKRSYLILSFNLEEGLYNRSVSFSITYLLYGATARDIIGGTGISKILEPLDTGTWEEWHTSLVNKNTQTPRGYAQLSHPKEFDRKMDLVNQELPGVPDPQIDDDDAAPLDVFRNPCPDKDASWIQYESHLEIIGDSSGVIVHKQLQAIDSKDFREDERGVRWSNAGTFIPISNIPGGNNVPLTHPEKRQVTQVRRAEDFRIVVTGFGVRMGFDFKPPILTKIGGIPITRLDGQGWVKKNVQGAGSKCPIYTIQWRIEYKFDEELDPTETSATIPAGDIAPPIRQDSTSFVTD